MKKTLILILLILVLAFSAIYTGKNTILRHFYPIKYTEQVKKYSTEYGVDEYLIYACVFMTLLLLAALTIGSSF